ncbi:MAG: TMEM14 family protein [Verrucomicrobiota bacterium]|nr:TMEM14 family protein [Verrucomicrobiota bacterium]
MIGVAKIYFIIFGLLTIIGGVIGFVKAGSTASIIAGSVLGILLLAGAWLLPTNLPIALVLLFVLSAAIAAQFVPKFIKTGQPMPAGLMSILSIIGVVMAIVTWIKK